MPKTYWRPIAQTDAKRPSGSYSLAGGRSWFSHCERLTRDGTSERIPIAYVPDDVLKSLSHKRPRICGLDLASPQIMGILNVTPDSFSDGGEHNDLEAALDRAKEMIGQGADILDIGGESTRPGADFVDQDMEIARTVPVIEALAAQTETPISIDTRKAAVADAAMAAGAALFNDVSALSFDPESAATAARLNTPVCLMHASGDPKTMQENPVYENVLLEVYDYLEDCRNMAISFGVNPQNIILDPGIGFGKTTAHNLALLKGFSLFHGLGCPLLLGASRKRFIGSLSDTKEAHERMPGSLAIALEGIRQGAQILRVHDVAATKQAMTLWHHLHI